MNGDIRLRVEGLMLERLIERALSEGARFKSVRRTGAHTMEVATDPAGERILTALCERFSIPCAVMERGGHTRLFDRMRRRASALIGVFVCAAIAICCLSRVWMIEIQPVGGAAIDEGALRARLEEIGVHAGVARGSVDPELLALEMRALSPEYSFIGVRLQGVRLLLEASRENAAPETFDIDDPRDLVASCAGVVVSVNVRAGEACVKAGDTVVKGQTLIRGAERIGKEERHRVAALGEVIARTWATGEATAPAMEIQMTPTGRERTSSELRLGSLSWAIQTSGPFESEKIQTEILPIGGMFLPLEIVRTRAAETRAAERAVDEDKLMYALDALSGAQARVKLNGVQAFDEWTAHLTNPNGDMTARAVIEAKVNIAVPREALIIQGGTQIGND